MHLIDPLLLLSPQGSRPTRTLLLLPPAASTTDDELTVIVFPPTFGDITSHRNRVEDASPFPSQRVHLHHVRNGKQVATDSPAIYSSAVHSTTEASRHEACSRAEESANSAALAVSFPTRLAAVDARKHGRSEPPSHRAQECNVYKHLRIQRLSTTAVYS